jgi:hypothetical protein
MADFSRGILAALTGGRAGVSRQTITRPANATPYTAGDVVGGAIEFTNIAPAFNNAQNNNGGQVTITCSKLEIDVAAIPTGMTSFRLYLYSVTPPSTLVDNAAWDLPAGDRAAFLGYIDLGTPLDLGSTLFIQTNNIGAQFAAQGTSLFGYLVTNGGFTPAGNSEVYKVILNSVAP